jgi:hypothetical protein
VTFHLTVHTRASSALNWFTSWREFREHLTRREFLSSVHAEAFVSLHAVQVALRFTSWNNLRHVRLRALARLLLVGQVTLRHFGRLLGVLGARHLSVDVTRQVADNRLLDVTVLDWFWIWFGYGLADATSGGVNHSWMVIITA